MSNIHGLDHNRRAQNNNQGNGGQFFQGRQGEVPNFLSVFLSQPDERPHPRKESFLQMLKFAFCPNLTWNNFISLISMVQVVTYLITVVGSILTQSPKLTSQAFLGPNP